MPPLVILIYMLVFIIENFIDNKRISYLQKRFIESKLFHPREARNILNSAIRLGFT